MAVIDLINRTNFLPTKIPIKVPAEKVNEVLQRLNSITADDGTLIADTIAESTSGTGVTIDGVLIKDGTVTTTAPLITSVAPAITAHAGGTKAAAYVLTEELNVITVCATALDSVLLPAAVVGLKITLVNLGVATCAVYAAGTNTIDDIITTNPAIVQPEDVVTFYCYTTAKWQSDFESDGVYDKVYTDTISENTATAGVTIDGVKLKDGGATVITGGANTFNITNGTAIIDVAAASNVNIDANLAVSGASTINQDVSTGGSPAFVKTTTSALNTRGNTTGITAFATGGQASAVALTTDFNNVTVCATAHDSVKLPTAVAGLSVTVKNSGATLLDIFPADADSIDALAINLAVSLNSGSTITFNAISGVVWESSMDDAITINSPTTATGQLVVKAAASAGNTVTTITNASQAAARTYTVPDAGAAANFVLSEGAATINGIKTFGSGIVLPVGAVGTPSVQIGAVDTGLYLVSAVQTGFAQDGVLVSVYDSEGIKPDSCQFRTAPGTLASAGVTVRHYGDGRDVTSVFTLTNYIIGPLAGAAAAKVLVPPEALYIFPAGGHILAASRTSLGLTATGTAVTPDVGLGSVVGDGSAFATLNLATVGITVEDILTGYAIADTVTHAAVASGPITPTAGALAGIALNKATDSKNLFLNAAATWNADNTGNLTATGTITVKWTIM